MPKKFPRGPITDPMQRDQMNEYSRTRNAKGLCRGCPSPPLPGRVYCSECKTKQIEGMKSLYKKRVSQGVCVDCSSVDLATKRRCEKCRQIVNERQRNRHRRSHSEQGGQDTKEYSKLSRRGKHDE